MLSQVLQSLPSWLQATGWKSHQMTGGQPQSLTRGEGSWRREGGWGWLALDDESASWPGEVAEGVEGAYRVHRCF